MMVSSNLDDDYDVELKRFGDLQPGDLIPGIDNSVVEVDQVFDVHTPDEMFEIVTEEGETLKASGNHLFYVETELDISSHRIRKKNGKKWVKTIPNETVSLLEDWAWNEEEIEIMLADFSSELGAEPESPESSIIARIAESLGAVSEISFQYDNIEEPEENGLYQGSIIPAYDRKEMSRQVLSFFNSRKYPWKTIVGKVMPLKELANLSGKYWIPDFMEK